MAAKKKTPKTPVEKPAKSAPPLFPADIFKLPPTPEVQPASTPPASTPFLAKVESNVKGGVNRDLGACTAIVSERNRAGKTAVLDAIRLALTGQHPIGPHMVDLVGLTADETTPWARVTGPSASASLAFPKGKRPEHTLDGDLAPYAQDASRLLPLVAMRDLLTLGTAKAREELFRRFGGSDELPSPVGLDDNQRILWSEALASAQGDVVERLSQAGSFVRSHKRTLSAQVKALEEAKAAFQQTAPVTDDVVRNLEARLEAVRQFAGNEALRAAFRQVEERLVSLIGAYEAAPKPMEPEALQKALAALDAAASTVEHEANLAKAREALVAAQNDSRLYSLIHKLRKRIPTDGCLACGGQVHGNAQPLIDAAEKTARAEAENVRTLSETVEAGEQALSDLIRRRDDEKTRVRLDNERTASQHAALVAALKAAKGEYERLQALVTSAGGVEAPADNEATLRAELAAARMAKLTAAKASGIAAELRDLKTAQQDAKAVESVLATTLDTLAGGVKTAAEDAVNRWMPPGFRATLTLVDAEDKPTCRWEVVGSDGRSHPRGAASGAEWSALAVAIACAWSEGQKHRFLLLDDADIAGFNGENIRAMLDTVSAAVRDGRLTQAFVAWSRPNEVPTEGWTVVRL